MELAICFLGKSEVFYGIDNHYIIYETLSYNRISTPRKLQHIYRCIKRVIRPNLDTINNINIEIIKRIQVTDNCGYNYECAIYYTYLLRIIQRRWRKKMKLREKYNHPLFVNFIKQREVMTRHMGSKRDTGIIGLFYGNLVFS